MELFKLLGTIAISNSEANSAIDETNNKAASFSSTLADKFTSVGSFATNLGKKITGGMAVAGTAIAAGATAIFKFAENSASAADTIDKMSQKIGISREAYQELAFICSQSGTSVDTLQMGMKTLTNQMQSAQSGTASAVEAFDKLGVSIYDSSGNLKDQETMMWETMTALQNMENQTEKAALANDLFGRSGSELMPLLNGAAGSINEMRQQAHDLGLVMSNETVDAGVKMTDTIDQAKRAFNAIWLEIGAQFMPLIQELVAYIVLHMPEIREKISVLVDIARSLAERIKDVVEWFSGLDEGTQKIIIKIGLLVVAAGPLLTMLGTIISVIGNVIQIGGSLTGGIGSLIGKVSGAGGLIPALAAIPAPVWIIIGVFTALVAAGVLIYKNWDEIKEWGQKTWSSITETVSGAVEKIGGFFSGLCESGKEKWIELRDGVVQRATELKDGAVSKVEELKEGAGRKLQELKEGADQKFSQLRESATEKIENLRENAVNKFNQLKESATEKVNSLKENAVSRFNELKDKASEKIHSLQEKGVEGFESLKSKALEKFDNLKSGITEKLDAVSDFVSGAVKKLQDFFKFDWSLPKIKLPHFSISGSFSLDPPSIPHIGVEWYKKAMDSPMIMDKPTAFGINASGQIMAGGEAGSEVVSGTQTLMNMISAAVADNNEDLYRIMNAIYMLLMQYLPEFSNMRVVLDTGETVGALAEPMSNALGRMIDKKGRGV